MSARNEWGMERDHRHLFPRSHASYFRVPFLIFVPSLLSESLGQAKTHVAHVPVSDISCRLVIAALNFIRLTCTCTPSFHTLVSFAILKLMLFV